MIGPIERHLTEVLRTMILKGVNEFWLCEEGTFNCLTRIVAKDLRQEFPWILLRIFPAYYPSYAKMDWFSDNDYDLFYPDEMQKVPPRLAILRRNKYIAQNADYIVCYVKRASGGAFKAMKEAQKYDKKIINLAEYV